MNTGLAGKVVVVTGASQGIGRATAERFVEDGACVALSDMTPDVVPVAEALAREYPFSQAFGVITDVWGPGSTQSGAGTCFRSDGDRSNCQHSLTCSAWNRCAGAGRLMRSSSNPHARR